MSTSTTPITTLFLDLGGVLLTNGWGRASRRLASETFHLDFNDMDERHHLSFNTYEDGKLSLDQYLDQVIFHQPRQFPRDEFKAFMYAQSQPLPDMLNFVPALKVRHHLRLVAVSNEGRELSNYRVDKFGLRDFIDAFVVSSYVHYRKPDKDIYMLALDIAQARADQVIYIDDRPLFIEVAGTLGIQSIRHHSLEQTQAILAVHGLTLT
jgi:putative hydrolase of the HAD superfamily